MVEEIVESFVMRLSPTVRLECARSIRSGVSKNTTLVRIFADQRGEFDMSLLNEQRDHVHRISNIDEILWA